MTTLEPDTDVAALLRRAEAACGRDAPTDDELAARTAGDDERELSEHLAALTALADDGTLPPSAAQLLIDLATAAGRDPAIAEAKQLLMAQHSINGAQAFAFLRHLSQIQNVKLRDVAHDLVQRLSEPPSAPR
jgi:hypothetical protein